MNDGLVPLSTLLLEEPKNIDPELRYRAQMVSVRKLQKQGVKDSIIESAFHMKIRPDDRMPNVDDVFEFSDGTLGFISAIPEDPTWQFLYHALEKYGSITFERSEVSWNENKNRWILL